MFILFFLLSALAIPFSKDNDPNDILYIHNKERSRLGIHHLQWNYKLQQNANSHAQQLSYRCELKHDPQSGVKREFSNLSRDRHTVSEATYAWLNERGQSWDDAKHYRMMIEKRIQYVGCAVVKDWSPMKGRQCQIVSCHYK
jgi:uncharacterized protein YkwD